MENCVAQYLALFLGWSKNIVFYVDLFMSLVCRCFFLISFFVVVVARCSRFAFCRVHRIYTMYYTISFIIRLKLRWASLLSAHTFLCILCCWCWRWFVRFCFFQHKRSLTLIIFRFCFVCIFFRWNVLAQLYNQYRIFMLLIYIFYLVTIAKSLDWWNDIARL